MRIEPDGANVITASGDAGTGSLNGLAVGTDSALANEWLSDVALVGACEKPTDEQDERILVNLRSRFNIVHT